MTTANTVIACTSVAGVGASLQFNVTVGGQASVPSSAVLSYSLPFISGVAGGDSMATAGGVTITLSGVNFGPVGTTVSATYGVTGSGYTASGCTVAVGHTTVTCVSIGGVGAALTWKLTVGGQTSAASSGTVSYVGPAITVVSGGSSMPTGGGTLISLTGTHFGSTSGHVVTAT